MTDKKIKLTNEEIVFKTEQVEELSVGIEGTELQIKMLTKEIDKDLPMRQAKSRLKSITRQLEQYKKTKEVLIKQLANWK